MRSALAALLPLCAALASLACSATSASAAASSPSASSPLARLAAAGTNASWFSVCVTSTPSPPPSVQPLPSPIPMPRVDDKTSAINIQLVPGLYKDCVAWGFHSDDIETVGWTYLSVETNPSFPDLLQSRAAGYLEGYLASLRIYQNTQILLSGFFPPAGPSAAVLHFLNGTVTWNLDMYANIGGLDPYWAQIANMYMQVQGLFEGYTAANTVPAHALSWFDIFALNLEVDIGDVTTAVGLYSAHATEEERAAAQAKVDARAGKGGQRDTADMYTHCSSLVKVLSDHSDIFHGHTTWSHFATALRSFKLYTMPLSVSKGGVSVHMSSYPGLLFSSDDWYQTSPALLSVSETTNDIYNPALYASIDSHGVVLLWARTIAANRLAIDGASYSEVMSRYNSGTCNNQWIIVDHKLFTPGAATLQQGLLTVAEQMPGAWVVADQTPHLQSTGYWSSFNIPYYNLTYHVSGYDHGCQSSLGPYVCGYEENYRYLLFASLQDSVVDLPSMQHVQLYNEYTTNPLQKGPSYAIAARYDLRAATDGPEAFGGLDCKITSDAWMKAGALRVSAISGPTHDTLPPFCWTGQWAAQKPAGMPTCFDFDWVEYAAGVAPAPPPPSTTTPSSPSASFMRPPVAEE